jgi:hypothetical protein
MRYTDTPASYPGPNRPSYPERGNAMAGNELGGMGQGGVEPPTSRLSVTIAERVNAGQLDTYSLIGRTLSGQVDTVCPVAVHPQMHRFIPHKNETALSSNTGRILPARPTPSPPPRRHQ